VAKDEFETFQITNSYNVKQIINNMSNYKEKFEAVKSFVTNLMQENTEELEAAAPEQAPMQDAPAEAAPQEAYVTLSQFNELKENTNKFMETVTEMLSSAMEMWNETEKNAVPQDLSKQEEVEEVELAAEPFVHDPEAEVSSKPAAIKVAMNRAQSTSDVINSMLFGGDVDLSIYQSK
jgi:recombination DNA repair RAD52 pathway protein